MLGGWCHDVLKHIVEEKFAEIHHGRETRRTGRPPKLHASTLSAQRTCKSLRSSSWRIQVSEVMTNVVDVRSISTVGALGRHPRAGSKTCVSARSWAHPCGNCLCPRRRDSCRRRRSRGSRRPHKCRRPHCHQTQRAESGVCTRTHPNR